MIIALGVIIVVSFPVNRYVGLAGVPFVVKACRELTVINKKDHTMAVWGIDLVMGVLNVILLILDVAFLITMEVTAEAPDTQTITAVPGTTYKDNTLSVAALENHVIAAHLGITVSIAEPAIMNTVVAVNMSREGW